uniref:Non-specific serine/threonine protein kinase n=1 Tax=Alexandrium catenella TaxID=2925 RepID=A0A7S1MM73_ALECA|mmetsp:Transcript_29780/g.80551  ORF Transcript_29780/g.80551 Transcript_29780/m.80551 type:complete len:516 (+) Transcript_29780:130-1677(+)
MSISVELPRPEGRKRAGTRGVRKSVVIAEHDSSSLLEEHYEEVRELGAGAFGKVTLVRDLTFGQQRVCKVVSTKGMIKPVLDAMRKEIELLRKLDHPSIVRIYEFAEDPFVDQILLILEYIPGGDCADLIKKSHPVEECVVGRLMYQLLAALHYCHLRGVAHRDIKPLNMMVLYPPDGGDPDCKLIDFGLSERGRTEMRDYVGSPKYMAPEVHRRATYTAAADIWSSGVTALELFAGDVPFTGPYEQTIGRCKGFAKALEPSFKGKEQAAWATRSDGAKDFVRHLMQVDDKLRPTAGKALEHSWLQENRPEAQKFPKHIARSLAGYANAPSVVRCCLLSIAARVGSPKMQAIGHAFLGADSNGDGLISDQELEVALGNMDEYKWWCDPASHIDVSEVLRAGDFDHSSGLNFTEFVAACLFTAYGNAENFASVAFNALDSDRDGKVTVKEVESLFRERDKPFLDSLPQDRPFGLEEWKICVEEYDEETQELSSSSSEADTSIQPRQNILGFFSCMT